MKGYEGPLDRGVDAVITAMQKADEKAWADFQRKHRKEPHTPPDDDYEILDLEMGLHIEKATAFFDYEYEGPFTYHRLRWLEIQMEDGYTTIFFAWELKGMVLDQINATIEDYIREQ